MALPAVIGYCKITGLFLEATADTSGDPDDLPQGNPLVGATVTFRAAPSAIRTSSPAATTIPREFVCSTDASGYLYVPRASTPAEDPNVDAEGNAIVRGVTILASDDPDIEPHNWSWYFKVYRDDLPSISGSFIATADGEIDLATVVQVPASPGAETAAWIQAVTEAQSARDAAVDAQLAAEDARDALLGAADVAATGDSLAQRTSSGTLVVAPAVASEEAVTLGQMDALSSTYETQTSAAGRIASEVTRANGAYATTAQGAKADSALQAASLDVLAERTVKAFLPPRIYTVIGRQTDVYFWNFIRASNPDAYAVRDDYRTADVMNLGDRYRIIPTATLTQSINLRVWDCEYQAATALTSLRHVSDASKPTVNALVIGDSMTDAGVWLAEVKRLMGANLTLRGSRSTTVNDAIGGSQTVAHEGRSGWSVNNYVNSASYGAPGTNPFYSGGTFNFGYYMANTGAGYGTLTDVFIMLGTNDVGQSIATATIVNNLKAMVNSVKAYSGAIKVHVILQPPPIRSGYGFGTRNWTNLLIQKNAMHDLWVALRPELLTLSVDMIAAGLVVDCWYDFPQTTVAQSQRNPTTITVGNENVHPNSYGYWKIADLVYAHMIGYTP